MKEQLGTNLFIEALKFKKKTKYVRKGCLSYKFSVVFFCENVKIFVNYYKSIIRAIFAFVILITTLLFYLENISK